MPEIKTILQTSDRKLFIRFIHLKINELSKEINQYRQIITEMQEMIEKKVDLIQGERRAYDILLGMRKEVRVISQRLQINIADVDKCIDSLYDKAEESNIQLRGVPSVIFFDEEFSPDHSDIELMIPIIHRNERDISREWQIKKLPQKFIATTLHIGSYDYIGHAHIALEEWMECNGYCLDGPPYETYLKGPECDCCAEEYVTQICFPVIKKENQ